MTLFLKRLAMVAAVALAPAAALAKPAVVVTVGFPQVVIAPPPPMVVIRPPCPSPNHYWVEAGWRYDPWGRRLYVPGHWAPRVVYTHPVPRPAVHTVIVHRY